MLHAFSSGGLLTFALSPALSPLEIILKYFPDLTDQQRERFAQLGELYAHWNEQINVISRKDIEQLYERHVLHSLGIAKVIAFKEGTRILDIGTGGGFPGIPLAILFPECEFHLVDSIGKKIKVVQEVAAALELTNVEIEQARAESLGGGYDFVVSRAVARLAELFGWVKHQINRHYMHDMRNGLLALKGGDLKEELQEVKGRPKPFPLAAYFEEEFFETKKVIYVPVG